MKSLMRVRSVLFLVTLFSVAACAESPRLVHDSLNPDSSLELGGGVAAPPSSGTGLAPTTTTTTTPVGTGGDLYADGGATGAPGPYVPTANPALCHLAANQVLILGDSYVALDNYYITADLAHPFTTNLERLAREAGALAEGEEYRDHAQSGASMAGTPNIPAQLDDAIAADPNMKLLVMIGGGNDVLVNYRSCLEYGTEAELLTDAGCIGAIDDAVEAGRGIFNKAAATGVEAFVYFFYPHLPGLLNGGIGAGTYPNVVLDYAYPRVKKLCDELTVAPCFFVDMRAPFDADGDGMSDPGLINIDGIHPTAEGSVILAEEVWSVMQRECLASE